jgi:hypothetical protein
MRLQNVLVLIVSLVVVPVVSAQKDYGVCSQMVSDAAHNVGVSTASYDYADSIFEQNCEQDGSVKSSHVDLSVVVKAIPVQFGAGSDEQTVRNFCKTFSQDVRLRTATFNYNSQVVDSSLKTAVQCVDIITKGGGSTVVDRFLGADTLRLSVTAASGQTVEIRGIQPGLNTKCISPGRLMSINWDINTTHRVEANDGTYTIVCTRSGTPRPDLGPGVQFFNRTSIVMGTNFGGFDVYWPDQHVEPERDAERIAENIAALQNQVSQLQARLNAIGTDSDQPKVGFARGRPNQFSVCPAGQFVSGVGPSEWNSDHNDAIVANIQFQCRKAVVAP